MSHAAPGPARPPRHHGAIHASGAARAVTTRRWTVGVLAGSTVVLLAQGVLTAVAAWLFAWGWNTVRPGQQVSVDLLAIAADIAPTLLVGWCTGLAASAVLTRGRALGARTAGIAAGVLGATAGVAVASFTGLL